MVFENKELSWPNLFLSSPESLGDEHGCITLRWSLKVLVTNYFITEWLYITKKKKPKYLVTHIFRHLLFSSSNVLFVGKIFRQQIFYLFIYLFILLSYWVTIVFHHLKIYVVTKYFVNNYFCFIFLFFIKLWVKIFVFIRHHSSHFISHQKQFVGTYFLSILGDKI